ncbi:MAG: LPS translocon maturation chaperone LptM [Pseudomonadota bacterium]
MPSSPTILLLILFLSLSACGRKGKLEPDEKDSYPRQYPVFVEDTLK